MQRSFHPHARLHHAVDELPYLRKLYAELARSRLEWVADELGQCRELILRAMARLEGGLPVSARRIGRAAGRDNRAAEETIRDAFLGAAHGRLTVSYAAARPDLTGQGYVIRAVGRHPDGTPFNVRSDPFDGDLTARARQFAADLILSHRGKKPMAGPSRTPKLASIPSAFDKLLHGLEARAEKFLNRIEGADTRATTVFAKADERLTTAGASLDSVDQYLDQIEQATNGAPGSPLDGSAGS